MTGKNTEAWNFLRDGSGGGKLFSVYLAVLAALFLRDVFFVSAFVLGFAPLRYAGQAAFALALIFGIYAVWRSVPARRERGGWFSRAAIIFFCCIALVRMAVPDHNCDTLAYHLYLQQGSFADNVGRNFFPAGLQTFSLPLPDEVFGISRWLLGYRLGTAVNSLALIVLYLQLLALLEGYFKKTGLLISKPAVELAAFLVISVEYVFICQGTYLVDLLPLPLLLYALRLAVFEDDEKQLPRIALLLGFSAALKLTMLPYAVVLMAIAAIRFRQKRLASVVLFALPAVPYCVYNYVSTGNPVFPYFNTLFHSPYWPDSNFRDMRWSPHNFAEFIGWPVVTLLSPQRFSEAGVTSGRLCVLLAASLAWAAARLSGFFRGKRAGGVSGTVILAGLLSLYLWTATTAYSRYVIYVEILGGLAAVMIAAQLLCGENRCRVLGWGLVSLLCAQAGFCYYIAVAKQLNFSWYPSVFEQPQLYLENMALFGRDRALSEEDEKKLPADGVWLCYPVAGETALVNSAALPLINNEFNGWQAALARRGKARLFTLADRNAFIKFGELLPSYRAAGLEPAGASEIKPYFLPKGSSLAVVELAATEKRPVSAVNEITRLETVIMPELSALKAELARRPFKENGYTLLSIGVSYKDFSYLDKAEYFLKQSLAAMSEAGDANPYPEYFLGDVAERRERFAEAKRYYEAACAKGGNSNPAFSQALERIKRK